MVDRKGTSFGDSMGMEVAFSNTIAVELTDTKKMVWISGQLAFNNKGEIEGKNDIEKQTKQCIENIQSAIKENGGSLDDIVRVTVFVKELSGLDKVHKVRLKYFNKPYPVSTLVQITEFVSSEALIEIEATAVVDN